MNLTKAFPVLAGALLASIGVPAVAQDAPSWRTDAPTRAEAPPEIERPDYGFTIDREALMGDEPSFDRPDSGLRKQEVSATAPASAPEPELVDPVLEEQVEAIVETTPEPEAVASVDPEAAVTANPEPAVLSDPAPKSVPVTSPAEPERVEADGEKLVSLTSAPEPVQPAMNEVQSTASAHEAFDLVRRQANPPVYPRQAWLERKEGWVDLLVTVSPEGKVEDVDVVDAEPRRIFERSAVRAALKWEFDPPSSQGVTQAQQGLYRIAFTMGE